MSLFRSILFVLIIALMSGCSQRFQDVNATINEAIFGFDDITLNKEQVANLPYASMYVRINQGSQIFMVLAFAENNPATGNTQLKWLSSDGAMITTENGRIVKTSQLPSGNLTGLSSSTNLAAPENDTASWQSEYDWQPGYHYGKRATVESYPAELTVTESLLWKKETRHIQEVITFADYNEQIMKNDYWIDNQGKVVKSQQWLIPNLLQIDIEILKPYVE